MSAAAAVRCPRCGRVAFAIHYGLAEGKHCGWRITAIRPSLDAPVKIVGVDRPRAAALASQQTTSPT